MEGRAEGPKPPNDWGAGLGGPGLKSPKRKKKKRKERKRRLNS